MIHRLLCRIGIHDYEYNPDRSCCYGKVFTCRCCGKWYEVR